MPAASTNKLSVQVSDFEDIRLLIQLVCLICDFYSSGQRFACGFLQIPPRDGHPCRPANDSPCRVRRRLSLPSKSALPGAQKKRGSGRLRSLPPSPIPRAGRRSKIEPYGQLNYSRMTRKDMRCHVEVCPSYRVELT